MEDLLSLEEFLKIKTYNKRKLDKDVVSHFKGFLKHRCNIKAGLSRWNELFDRFTSDDPIFSECSYIKTYPILVYSEFEDPLSFHIFAQERLSCISNNWCFERRFKTSNDALQWIGVQRGNEKEEVELKEKDLFDPKYIKCMWSEELKGVNVFLANDIPTLKKVVNGNETPLKVKSTIQKMIPLLLLLKG